MAGAEGRSEAGEAQGEEDDGAEREEDVGVGVALSIHALTHSQSFQD